MCDIKGDLAGCIWSFFLIASFWLLFGFCCSAAQLQLVAERQWRRQQRGEGTEKGNLLSLNTSCCNPQLRRSLTKIINEEKEQLEIFS